MLDRGFKPQVDRLFAGAARRPADHVLLRDTRRRGGRARPRVHPFSRPFRGRVAVRPPSGEIDHRFVPVTPENKVSTLVELLKGEEQGLALVFVRTKARCRPPGREAAPQRCGMLLAIHGDKGQAQREKALEHFDAGKVKTLVATDVAARGLDVDDISHVVNFDPPEEPDGLHPPRRPHRPRRQGWYRDHAGAARAAGGRLARRAPAGSRRAFRGDRHAGGEAPPRVTRPRRREVVRSGRRRAL